MLEADSEQVLDQIRQDEGFEEALFEQPPVLATIAHLPAPALQVSDFSSFLAGITHILGVFIHI